MAKELLRKRDVDAWLASPSTTALHDGGGLYLRKRGAHAYFYLRQRNAETGARTWAPLFPPGPSAAYPARDLDEARRAAAQAREIADAPGGLDLIRGRRAEVERMQREAEDAAKAAEAARIELERRITMRTLFDRWRAVDLQPRPGADGRRQGRKDGGEYTAGQFGRYVFPRLGARAAVEVTKADLMAILDEVKAAGKLRTANVLLTDLKQMFNFAVNRDIVDRNPLATITRREVGGAEGERERVLSDDELRKLAKALPDAGMTPASIAAVWLILGTACRVSEAMGARWEHVDLEARTWHLPQTKNERDHVIHLSDFVVTHFQALRDIDQQRVARALERERKSRGRLRPVDAAADIEAAGVPELQPSPWVFPNARVEGHVCVKSLGKQLADRQRTADRRLQHRSKSTESLALPGGRWTAHDLRRTAATIMANLGVSGDVIDECLNHVQPTKVRKAYIKDRRRAEQAVAFDRLGEVLASAASGEPAPAQRPALRRVA